MALKLEDGRPGWTLRLREGALGLGVVALLGGLVSAAIVVPLLLVNASGDRRELKPIRTASREVAPPASPPLFVPAAPAADLPAPIAAPVAVDAEGFVRAWLLLAPIPSQKGQAGAAELDRRHLPEEAAVQPRAGEWVKVSGRDLLWKEHVSPEFCIDFRKAVAGERGDDVVAYAVSYVISPEERRGVRLLMGSNDQARVYLNGCQVLQHERTRTLEKDQSVATDLKLRKGRNSVVFKVVNEKNQWQGCLRFADRTGAPMRDLQVSLAP
jgi:hypothetical protein